MLRAQRLRGEGSLGEGAGRERGRGEECVERGKRGLWARNLGIGSRCLKAFCSWLPSCHRVRIPLHRVVPSDPHLHPLVLASGSQFLLPLPLPGRCERGADWADQGLETRQHSCHWSWHPDLRSPRLPNTTPARLPPEEGEKRHRLGGICCEKSIFP